MFCIPLQYYHLLIRQIEEQLHRDVVHQRELKLCFLNREFQHKNFCGCFVMTPHSLLLQGERYRFENQFFQQVN